MDLINILAKETPKVSQSLAITFLVVGLICLALGIGVIFLLKEVLNRRKAGQKREFAVEDKKFTHKIFNFWIHYLYIFIIGVCFIAGLVLFGIGLGYFI
ncbi:MPN207a family PTS transporter accessory protein [Williamsoniiplasma lucivorax]|uniref:Uncharacterized protein n=1 Tax=Williamsoniiplasma lucivorax TaxID=209274 RepID=A0A2S5REL3_9MOLU|nr:hypothetical protein [Williamsoniiplasma lucivorax]PPE05754.1 hypothetical protein ELUCI_v1c00410 [Williamsoniiplasma lucivorax]